ncbi:PH domain-containing protein [Thermodesulfobacteriota bacterium]
MEKIEFRPTKVLLVFWLIGAAAVGVPVASSIAATLLVYSMGEAFAIIYPILMVLAAIPIVFFFFSIRYELDDQYITKSSGVLWKKRRSIPLEKITNIDVRQGPVERIFNYGKIWIFTPSTGASKPEEKLEGVICAHDMRQTISQRSEAKKQHKAVDVKEEPAVQQTGEVVSLLTEIRDSLKLIADSVSEQKEVS